MHYELNPAQRQALQIDPTVLKLKDNRAQELATALDKLSGKVPWIDDDRFFAALTAELLFKLSQGLVKVLRATLGKRNEEAEPVLDSDGKQVPDSELRDYENVPLKDEIETFFAREVLPHVPDAWMDRSKDKIGYEISFTQTQIVEYIAEATNKTEAALSSYTRQLTLLTEYRTALIHECVTGQRQVPDIPTFLQEAKLSSEIENIVTTNDELYRAFAAIGRENRHLSFFAFTATPKDKTLGLFGAKDVTIKNGFHPFHQYTMRQAIDEGFIFDVLKNYTTYKTRFQQHFIYYLERSDVFLRYLFPVCIPDSFGLYFLFIFLFLTTVIKFTLI